MSDPNGDRAPADPESATSAEPKPRSRKPDDPRVREALAVLDITARSMMRQVGGRVDIDDLKSFGHEAIADIIERFDESRGVSFRGYARLRLRGAILDGLRKESGLPRGMAARLRALEAADLFVEHKAEENAAAAKPGSAEVADAKIASFLRGLATAYATGLVAKEPEGPPADERDREDPEVYAQRKEARALLQRALAEMGEPEGELLRRHYFLDEDLQDAAAHLGLSKSWGSRLHARAIEKLGDKLAQLRGKL